MRVYISADMEGICGISSYDDVDPSSGRYERSRTLMEKELSFICNILKDFGVKEIVINDSHWYMNNLRIENLPGFVNLISGYPKPLSMMEGIDKGFDMCMFIGYHSAASTTYGHLAHTYSSRVINRIEINGNLCSEAYINALIASHFGVPVALISGDHRLKIQEEARFPNTEFVITKKGTTFNSALLRHPDEVFKDYENSINSIFKKGLRPIEIPEKLEFTVEFKDVRMTDTVEICPYVERIDALRVRFAEENIITAFKLLRTIVKLAT